MLTGLIPRPRVRIPPCPPFWRSARRALCAPTGGRRLLAVLLIGVLASGCVTRTFSIHSDPPGAEVRLDGVVVGTTPYIETFLSYGVREVDLRLPGHLRDVQEFELVRPWWQYFPADVIADLFWPAELLDEHQLSIELLPRSTAAGSWAQAQDAYEQFKTVRDFIHARSLYFAGRGPATAPEAPPALAEDPEASDVEGQPEAAEEGEAPAEATEPLDPSSDGAPDGR